MDWATLQVANGIERTDPVAPFILPLFLDGGHGLQLPLLPLPAKEDEEVEV